MLENDDFDDDFFTPVASTTLADIFGNKEPNFGNPEDKTLKYTPPKPQISPKPVDTKQTQCVYACALTAYEWTQNAYVLKGKVGFAIIKQTIGEIHNIVLYDSNKTTLSSTIVSTKLQIVINTNHLAFYDSLQKYWCLYATDNEVKIITEILKKFDIVLKYGDKTTPPDLEDETTATNIIKSTIKQSKSQANSDTDSSMNRKTKISILNRMASMGQSVLPAHCRIADRGNDSSDTEDSKEPPKLVRHKPPKNAMKKTFPDKSIDILQPQNIDRHNSFITKMQKPLDNSALYTFVNDILVPVTSTSIITNTEPKDDKNLDLFLTEQRVNNGEIRININRLNDKVDSVLNKMSDLHHQQKSTCTSTEVELLHKLLKEYESKIKIYEDLLRCKSHDNPTQNITRNCDVQKGDSYQHEVELLQNKVAVQEDALKLRENEIFKLKENLAELEKQLSVGQFELQNKINSLEKTLSVKQEELTSTTKILDNLSLNNTDTGVTDKVKQIMNETYQTVIANFNDDDVYSGNDVKKVIGKVIRKITVNALKK